MGRNKRKPKSIFIIINFVLVLAMLVLSFFEYQKYQDNIKKKDNVVNEYKEIMNDKEIDDKKIIEINAKIDELNNIDEKIKSTREEVYKLSSELEKKIKNNETKKKIAYLTFDDGPYYNTYKVLKILKVKNVMIIEMLTVRKYIKPLQMIIIL